MSRARVGPTDANVRSAPTTDASVLGVVRAGETVEAGALAPWRSVKTASGVSGWMHVSLLSDIEAPVPVKPPTRPKWRVAKSLDKLLAQVNAKAPKRNKIHDGSIGDAAHAATVSDHNPEPAPPAAEDRTPVVRARDLTHDPKNGFDAQVMVDRIVASKDRRVSYLIFNRRIWRSYNRKASATRPFLPAWTPERYTRENPHTKHAHVSVVADPTLYDDDRPWAV